MRKFEIVLSALDKISPALNGINKKMQKLRDSTRGVRRAFGKMTSTASKGFQKLTSFASGVIKKLSLMSVAGVGVFGLLISRSIDAIDSLGKTADKIGVTTEALAAMRYAAEQTGVSTQTMDMALQRFTRRASEAALGTGEAKNALKELGIDARKIAELPLTEQMIALSDAFSEFTEADQVRLAMRLFDSEGVALVNTLGLGADGLREMMQEAEDLGLTLSRESVAGAEKAKNAFNKLGNLFKGVTQNIVVGLAPAITALTDYLSNNFISAVKESDGSVAKFGNSMAIRLVTAAQTATVAVAKMINSVGSGLSTVVRKFDDFNIARLSNEMESLNKEFDTLNSISLSIKNPEFEMTGADRWYLFANRMVGDTEAIRARFAEVSQLIVNKGAELDELFANRKLVGEDLIDVDGVNVAFEKLMDNLAVAAIELDENFIGPVQQQFTNAFTGIKQTVTDAATTMARVSNQAMMSIFGSMQNILNGLMSVTEQGSKEYKTLFAISKAIAVAQAIVGANMAGASILTAYATAAPAVAVGGPVALTAWLAKGAMMAKVATALGYANAAVIGATAVQSFDGGGFTGSGARTGGLDNKGGFLAMLHPQETIIDHTKPRKKEKLKETTKEMVDKLQMPELSNAIRKMPSFEGGGYTGGRMPMSPPVVVNNVNAPKVERDPVVVNQNINVTTGIQATVRAEIQNLMPQIAEVTKSAVLQETALGGTYASQLQGN